MTEEFINVTITKLERQPAGDIPLAEVGFRMTPEFIKEMTKEKNLEIIKEEFIKALKKLLGELK